MTPQRWSRICDRRLAITLLPLLVTAIYHEVGYLAGTLLVIIVLVCGGFAGAFATAVIIDQHFVQNAEGSLNSNQYVRNE